MRVRGTMENNLNYTHEVIVTNKFVSDVTKLYPMSQYGFNCECKLCNGDGEKKKKIILILINMLIYQIFQMN